MWKLDLIRGSLIGGAAGDALGYRVEFMHLQEIIRQFGPKGITAYSLNSGVAEISDDTQMTLFTANGLLLGLTRIYMRGIGAPPESYTQYAYQDWYYTQTQTFQSVFGTDGETSVKRHTWLSALPGLYARRAPGNTCLSAISDIIQGKTPVNNSKGCGGVMRVAPWPLFCSSVENQYSLEEIDVAGGEIARLTHKHPLGWMPAIVLTHILFRLVDGEPLASLPEAERRQRFVAIVEEALNMLPTLKVEKNLSDVTWDRHLTLGEAFPNDVEIQTTLVRRALQLADGDAPDADNIRKLGDGWVGEEALAIAVYAVARHIDSFDDVVVAAVNHDGDSDSTGAVAGNIIGAIVGYETIPGKFKEHLELHDVVLAIADDLHQGCIISERDPIRTPEKQQWYKRYCQMMPAGM